MTLLIDNYDSFTFNLYQVMAKSGEPVRVVRNDEISVHEIAHLNPKRILLSPGPGRPDDAGVTLEVIKSFSARIPIFGVCLGHQSIAQAFGGQVKKAKRAKHGKQSKIYHNGKGIYHGLSHPFTATRYHSLIVERESLPDCLEVTSETEDGLIMGLKHREFAVEGVQFHPESIATVEGEAILRNFLRRSEAA